MDQNKLFSPPLLSPAWPSQLPFVSWIDPKWEAAIEVVSVRTCPPLLFVSACSGKNWLASSVIDILIAAQLRQETFPPSQSVSQWKYEKVRFNPIRFVYFQRIRKRLIFCIVRPDYDLAGRTGREVRAERWAVSTKLEVLSTSQSGPHWFANVWTHFYGADKIFQFFLHSASQRFSQSKRFFNS